MVVTSRKEKSTGNCAATFEKGGVRSWHMQKKSFVLLRVQEQGETSMSWKCSIACENQWKEEEP